MAFSKCVVTSAGRDLLLACMESGDFQIYSLVLGSGRYSGILTEIQAVVEPVAAFSGEELLIMQKDDQLEITARLSNELLEAGFNWREYGVYATDGKQTVLYCYDNAGDEPVPITAASTGAGISNTIKVILKVDSAATVNVSFEPVPEVALDDAVTENGENAVTGAAVYAFVNEGLDGKADADHNHAALYYNATIKRNANTVLAAPNGSSGEATFRKLVAADIPSLAASKITSGTFNEARIPSLAASKITAGTLAGKVQANASAAAELNTAQLRDIVMTATDPGAGATVDYPDGTVIHVYE